MRFLLFLLIGCFYVVGQGACASSLKSQRLICIEAVWCNIATQIAGDLVSPSVIIHSEGIEPHHFMPTPSIMRVIRRADILLINGAHYDDWARSFSDAGQASFIVSDLIHWQEGDDPHLFFDFSAVNEVAITLTSYLIKKYPEEKNTLLEKLKIFEETISHLKERQKKLEKLKNGQKIALIEPAGLRLVKPLSFDIINQKWAFDMMNDQAVSPRDTAFLEKNIETKNIHFLVINPILKGDFVENIIHQAQRYDIPLIQISEFLPHNMSWQEWVGDIYNHIEKIQ